MINKKLTVRIVDIDGYCMFLVLQEIQGPRDFLLLAMVYRFVNTC